MGISDDLINCEEFIKNEDILKRGCLKSLLVRYLMTRWLHHIQIQCGGSLGISGDLNSIGEIKQDG